MELIRKGNWGDIVKENIFECMSFGKLCYMAYYKYNNRCAKLISNRAMEPPNTIPWSETCQKGVETAKMDIPQHTNIIQLIFKRIILKY